jgi:predicted TIM-barrel fold metal-dependent hydrolase
MDRRTRSARNGAGAGAGSVPVVVDHMGRMDHRNGIDHPGFQALMRGVGEGRL